MDDNTLIGVIGFIGAVMGGVISGAAMILNSYFSTKFSSKQADQNKKRERLDEDIQEAQKLYEDILHLSGKLVRNEGQGSDSDLENFYRQEVKLKLLSTSSILDAFKGLKAQIADFSKNLPKMPEEFVPKFEDDDHRFDRLEKRKIAKQMRAEKAKEFRPELYKKHSELAGLMKNHLKDLK